MGKVLCLNLKKKKKRTTTTQVAGLRLDGSRAPCVGIVELQMEKPESACCVADASGQMSPVRAGLAKSPLTSTLLFPYSSWPFRRRGLCSWRVQPGPGSTLPLLLAKTPEHPAGVLFFPSLNLASLWAPICQKRNNTAKHHKWNLRFGKMASRSEMRHSQCLSQFPRRLRRPTWPKSREQVSSTGKSGKCSVVRR